MLSKNLLIIFAFFITLHSSLQFGSNFLQKKKCYALALEGGGDAGSWQAGVIYGLIKNLPKNEVQYDVISGVSVGSINGLLISQYEKGEEIQMVEKLHDYWYNFSQEQCYNSWGYGSLGILRGFYDKRSIYNNEPLQSLIKKQIKERNIKRKFSVGITDSTNAQQIVVDIDELSPQQQFKSIIASTSMPFIFPYMNTTKQIFIDGGVLINIDLHSAIRRCRQIVDSDSDIILDAILPTGAFLEKQFANQSYTGFQMFRRYRQLSSFKYYLDDIMHQMIDYPQVKYRYIIMPQESIPSWSIPIQFDQQSMRQMIELGIKDAISVLNNQSNSEFVKKINNKERKKIQDGNDNYIWDNEADDVNW